jgi:hypothetical protein
MNTGKFSIVLFLSVVWPAIFTGKLKAPPKTNPAFSSPRIAELQEQLQKGKS